MRNVIIRATMLNRSEISYLMPLINKNQLDKVKHSTIRRTVCAQVPHVGCTPSHLHLLLLHPLHARVAYCLLFFDGPVSALVDIIGRSGKQTAPGSSWSYIDPASAWSAGCLEPRPVLVPPTPPVDTGSEYARTLPTCPLRSRVPFKSKSEAPAPVRERSGHVLESARCSMAPNSRSTLPLAENNKCRRKIIPEGRIQTRSFGPIGPHLPA